MKFSRKFPSLQYHKIFSVTVIGDNEELSGVLSIRSCQDCDNTKSSSSTSHQMAVLGCPSLVVPKVKSLI